MSFPLDGGTVWGNGDKVKSSCQPLFFVGFIEFSDVLFELMIADFVWIA